MSRKKRFYPTSAFTLIELLTVIAIIGILAAIIIPTVAQVRKSARDTQCRSNLHQIGLAVHLYAQDNRNKFPAGNDYNIYGNAPRLTWDKALIPYLGGHMTGNPAVDYDDIKRTKTCTCPSAVPAAVWPGDNTQYSANENLVSLGYTPALLDVVTRPSETVYCTDGVIRAGVSSQAHGMIRNTIIGVSSGASPDQPVTATAPDPLEGISYRHASDSTNAVMVDASVRTFKRGTLKNRNFVTDF